MDGVPRTSTLRFGDLAVGQTWGPFAEPLTAATSDRVRTRVGVAEPGAGAPLGVLPLLTLRALRRALRGIIPGGVLVRQTFTAADRLPAAGTVDVHVWVSEQRARRSGLYTTFTFALAHEARTPAVVEWTILAPPDDA